MKKKKCPQCKNLILITSPTCLFCGRPNKFITKEYVNNKWNKNYNKNVFDYIFIEEGIIMGIHGEKPPLMKTRKKIVIEEARLLWQKLLNEGWQKTNKKW